MAMRLLLIMCSTISFCAFCHQLDSGNTQPREYIAHKRQPKSQRTILAQTNQAFEQDEQSTPTPSLSFCDRVGNWLKEKPALLFAFGFTTVTICCMGSQALVRFSKQANISLNKYYQSRRAEKHRTIQRMLEAA